MNTANKISTISEFLLHAGTEYIIIDVSRGRQLFDNQEFFDIENAKQPYPRPRQNCAWLCVMFWNKQDSDEHYIWYLKLPLDERGLLQLAARDQFLQILMEALGNQMQLDDSLEQGLPENPFVFQPSQQMRADCNAMLKLMLRLPLSEKATVARQYLASPEIIDWRGLSVQNFSDAIANLTQDAIENITQNQLTRYPNAVLTSLFSGLEGLKLNEESSKGISKFVKTSSDYIRALALRSMSHAEYEVCKDLLTELLSSADTFDVELLVVIAGRHWKQLTNEDLLHKYLNKVLLLQGEENLFLGIYADLVSIPELRPSILSLFNNKELEPQLLEELHQIKTRMQAI